MALRLEIVPQKAAVVKREESVVAACWFGPFVQRPYVYPFVAPGGLEVTRLGHPLDPLSHSHHKSIWIGHHDVSGANFWEESAEAGRIEVRKTAVSAASGVQVGATFECAWVEKGGRTLLEEKRTLIFVDLPGEELALEIEVELAPPVGGGPVVLGDTPFGLLGIRVARTMRVAEKLGGLILNSGEAENESACLWQHALWCDYSGPVPSPGPLPEKAGEAVLPAVVVGVACFDHPANSPSGDTLWHVRDDGWMGPCISKGQPRTIAPGTSLRARYRIEAHRGRPGEAGVDGRARKWRKG